MERTLTLTAKLLAELATDPSTRNDTVMQACVEFCMFNAWNKRIFIAEYKYQTKLLKESLKDNIREMRMYLPCK